MLGTGFSIIVDQLPPVRWRHVPGVQNQADCASRGLFPLELKNHMLWWNTPEWLRLNPLHWSVQPTEVFESFFLKHEMLNTATFLELSLSVIPSDRHSSFTRLKLPVCFISLGKSEFQVHQDPSLIIYLYQNQLQLNTTG